MKKKLTKEEFEKRYIERSGIPEELYYDTQVTLPCNCGDKTCLGWAAVTNSPLSIKAHNDLYR